jgi:N-acyl-D-aspartate/D-glutamate deacylase
LIFRLENFTFFDSSRSWAETFIGGDRNQILQRLQDERLRAGIRYEEAMLIKEAIGGSIEGVSVFAVGDHPELERYVGRKVGDIAAEENKLPVDVLLDLTLASELDAEFKCKSFGGINPDMLGEVARSPYVIPGISDGGAHTKFLVGASYPTDLLAWLVRDEKQLTLEDAHWHLSHLPAHIYGLKDRGVIREGAAADIVVYDLDRLGQVPATEFEIAHDFPAGEWRRIQRAAGYRWILVNGEVTFEEGECSKATPGRLLRNGVG